MFQKKFSLIVLVAAVAVFASAQQPAQQTNPLDLLKVMHEKDLSWMRAEAARFTGEVNTQSLPIQNETMRAARVRFNAGAHTNWHVHRGGQLLYIEKGRGRVQRWGGAIEEFGAGDLVYTAPGEKHWHGATPDAAMTHIAVSIAETDWKERVTDEQYAPKHKQ